MVNIIGGTCIGYQSDCAFNYSTSIGYQSTCTADRQIMLGTAYENVVVPANLSVAGSINNISKNVFGFLSNVSSDIQSQINSLKTTTTDISWIAGTINRTDIRNACSTSILTFSQSLNSISATTFGYLANVTSDIQNQINAISNRTPVGSVIQFAGIATNITGYLPCDGTQFFLYEYPALFSVIQYTYGGDEATGRFRVPNYQGIFLRGAGSQIVSLNAIAGSGNPVAKTYTSPSLGTAYADETQQITTSNYVNQINQEVKTFVTGGSGFGGNSFNFNYANAVASLNYTVANDTINRGHVETFPVHTSIKYFIKY